MGVFQKLLERYNKCITAGGDYFEGDHCFMCVLSIEVPIRKKSGNFNDPRRSRYYYAILILLFRQAFHVSSTPIYYLKFNLTYLICFYIIKWFQILLCFTNNSIKDQSFVNIQLNGETFLFLTVQFNVSDSLVHSFNVKQFNLIHRYEPIKCCYSRSKWTWEQWQWRGIQHFPIFQDWNLFISLLSVIYSWVDEVSVISSPVCFDLFFNGI